VLILIPTGALGLVVTFKNFSIFALPSSVNKNEGHFIVTAIAGINTQLVSKEKKVQS
jgi:hypothetical protein